MQKIYHILLIAQLIIVVAACSRKGDTGDRGPQGPIGGAGLVGPQGPTGPQGSVGPAGLPGATGPQGTPATIGVTYSSWAASGAANWVTTDANFYGAVNVYNRAAAGVTAGIRDQGVTLAFIRGLNTTQVAQLPYRQHTATGIDAHQIDYSLNAVGNIRFFYKYNGATGAFTTAVLGAIETRYILIPGLTAGSRIVSGPAAGYDVSQIKNMSYEQIRSIFNIPENGSNEK
jgi:hypothetical protein